MRHWINIFLGGLFLLCLYTACQRGASGVVSVPELPPEKLSDYQFFVGDMGELNPGAGVLPYDLITPLFSDYAEKARFVWMPGESSAEVTPDGTIAFPVGTVLIKNFFYDQPDGARNIIETRLLIQRKDGWDPLTYVWQEDQTDAQLEIAGAYREVSFVHRGEEQTFEYVVPDKNQCKGCHEYKKEVVPVGPKAQNLNRDYTYADGVFNQLDRWVLEGYLQDYDQVQDLKTMTDWSDTTAILEDRALAYLEVNCGTCHNPHGAAYVSGLHLTTDVTQRSQLGICKGPVSAGKGSGGHQFDIVPGDPDASILLYRMISTDPGAMMPEIGRKLVHREGIALIRAWISSLDGDCEQS